MTSAFNGATTSVHTTKTRLANLRSFHVGYRYEILNESQTTNSTFTGGGAAFSTKGIAYLKCWI